MLMAIVAAVATAHSAVAQSSPEAEALMQRFVAHLNANLPVAGEFEMHGSFDPQAHEQDRLEAARLTKEKLKGRGTLTMQAAERLLACRWALSRDVEMMETLPSSRDSFKTFYVNRELSLEGFQGNSFNITQRKNIAGWRPASFYFLGGDTPWAELFPLYPVTEVRSPPNGSPPGSVQLVIRNPESKIEYRLLLDGATCQLHGYESFFDSKPFAHMTIQEVARGPGQRLFPTRAELTLARGPNYHQPFRTERLAASRVRFPTSQSEVESSFALSLPKGAIIADRVLNRSMLLDRSTSVQEVVSGKLPSNPSPELTTDLTTELYSQPSTRWYWIAGVGCIVAAIALGTWLIRRWSSQRVAGGRDDRADNLARGGREE